MWKPCLGLCKQTAEHSSEQEQSFLLKVSSSDQSPVQCSHEWVLARRIIPQALLQPLLLVRDHTVATHHAILSTHDNLCEMTT
jgi:hypothetical protein